MKEGYEGAYIVHVLRAQLVLDHRRLLDHALVAPIQPMRQGDSW